MHVQGSKFGGKFDKFEGKSFFFKLNSAEFMELVFSKSEADYSFQKQLDFLKTCNPREQTKYIYIYVNTVNAFILDFSRQIICYPYNFRYFSQRQIKQLKFKLTMDVPVSLGKGKKKSEGEVGGQPQCLHLKKVYIQ